MELMILAVPDCPGAPMLDERLAHVLQGRRGVTVSRHVITGQDEAARRGMCGSPTVRGDVEHGEVAEAAIQQRSGDRGCAAARVDDGVSGRDPGRVEHPKRHVRMFLEPAPGVIALGVGGVPVRPCRCRCLVRHPLILCAAVPVS
jgi:hypothetical protein